MMMAEGDVTSMDLDSSFRLKVRMSKGRGQEVSLFVGAPQLEGAQLIVDEQEVNKVKMESSAACLLRLKSGFGRFDASDPFHRSFITKNLCVLEFSFFLKV